MQRTTESVTISFDINLRYPRDGRGLIALADVIEDLIKDLRSVAAARWVETIAVEPDFDYTEWNRIMQGRREVMRNG